MAALLLCGCMITAPSPAHIQHARTHAVNPSTPPSLPLADHCACLLQAMRLCAGDARSMGHAHRFFPGGQAFPEGLPVGTLAYSRAQMFVAGLCSSTMKGIELESGNSGPAVTFFAGLCHA